LEVLVFWALLESANGMDAQPARVAAEINNVPPRIRAAFAFIAIGIARLTDMVFHVLKR